MTKYKVEKMSCGHCTSAIEKSIRSVDPAAQVDCDLSDRTVQVDSALDDDAIRNAIREAGYEPAAA
ncbi:heavy-metal-associated domain-containing protein [Tranquillimonas alkanivorans]|uniref:Copper chaperone n=1 Tax=Tranquillimonas alkanivorans TaxID=441119 RepID=A0A1I5TN86_9RHOB|nr:heavy-metal-associated domain-containing protein [Tranquillimonas alkanivorans]SFP84519.1 copper chaperone [Tranquillimonas alkanivorans]